MSDLSRHLKGHMWPVWSRHLLWSTVDHRVDGNATHTQEHKHCAMLRAGWSDHHKPLTWVILSYSIPFRVCHVGTRHVLNLTEILPEAS